jgi:KaiC/GvpD/RAD55 family RecA-like ATPase
MAADWLMSGGSVMYGTFAQNPDDVRAKLTALGLNVAELEKSENLGILDCYTVTLGRKSKEKNAWNSLKIADLSIYFSQEEMSAPPEPEHMVITDDESTIARFNDEKAWVELELTRMIPAMRSRQMTSIGGIMKAIHSDWVYKRLEAASDGVIDFKLDDASDPPRNLMRIRSMRDLHFDGKWHELRVGEHSEVTLEKISD